MDGISENTSREDYEKIVNEVKKEVANDRRKFQYCLIEDKVLYGEKINDIGDWGIYDHNYDERYKPNYDTKNLYNTEVYSVVF